MGLGQAGLSPLLCQPTWGLQRLDRELLGSGDLLRGVGTAAMLSPGCSWEAMGIFSCA